MAHRSDSRPPENPLRRADRDCVACPVSVLPIRRRPESKNTDSRGETRMPSGMKPLTRAELIAHVRDYRDAFPDWAGNKALFCLDLLDRSSRS
jgi:hypothetical protein